MDPHYKYYHTGQLHQVFLMQAFIGAQLGTTWLPLCMESQELLSIFFFTSVEAIGLASDVVVMIVVVVALALAVQESDFGYSLALWPLPPDIVVLDLRVWKVSLNLLTLEI